MANAGGDQPHQMDETDVKRIIQEVMDEQEQQKKVLDQFWHELPANTYGVAIWAILAMDIDALIPQNIFLPSDDANVPKYQRWKGKNFPAEEFWARIKYRIFPYVNVGLFNLVVIFLCGATIGVQVGFAFLLNDALELNPSFKDTEATEYICGTTGYIQFISIGFFVAYMFGQMPRILKTWLLIWTSEFETTVDRGVDGKTKLFVGVNDKDEKDTVLRKSDTGWFKFDPVTNPADQGGRVGYQWSKYASKYRKRTREAMIVRRFCAWVIAAADMVVTAYVLYCGIRYIFWSGYVSLDPVFAEDPKFGPIKANGYPEGGFPWMSNTKGIEEVLMATLALVFIMDIDEQLFAFLLPRCVQNVVQDTRLSCVKWMPAHFDFQEFKNLGQPLRAKNRRHKEEIRNQKSLLEDIAMREGQTQAYQSETRAAETRAADPKADDKPKVSEDGDQLHEVDVKFNDLILTDYFDREDKNDDSMDAAKPLPTAQHAIEEKLTLFRESYEEAKNKMENKKGWEEENDYEDLDQGIIEYFQDKKKNKWNAEEQHKYAYLLLRKLQQCREQRYIDQRFEDFLLGWMAIVPLSTFLWVAFIIALTASVVILVRHGQGCGTFTEHHDAMPNMPETSDLEKWQAEALAFGPPSVILFGVLVYTIIYVKDIVWDKYEDGEIFKMLTRRSKAEKDELDIERQLKRFRRADVDGAAKPGASAAKAGASSAKAGASSAKAGASSAGKRPPPTVQTTAQTRDLPLLMPPPPPHDQPPSHPPSLARSLSPPPQAPLQVQMSAQTAFGSGPLADLGYAGTKMEPVRFPPYQAAMPGHMHWGSSPFI